MNLFSYEWWAKSARRGASLLLNVANTSIETLWMSLVNTPLRTLYFHGPYLKGVGGFWNGASEADACAQLTGVSSTVWGVQIEACRDLLDRNYTSFYVAVLAAVYLVCIYKALQLLAFRYFYVQPVMAEIRAMLQDRPTDTFPDSRQNQLENVKGGCLRGCFQGRAKMAARLPVPAERGRLCEEAAGHGSACEQRGAQECSGSGSCLCRRNPAATAGAQGSCADHSSAVHDWPASEAIPRQRRRANSPQAPRRSTSA